MNRAEFLIDAIGALTLGRWKSRLPWDRSRKRVEQVANYRLFRPLALNSPHYPRYRTDESLLTSVLRWIKQVQLGGGRYDLRISSRDVFQIQSNVLNRQAFVMPVPNQRLVQEIVARASRTRRTKYCPDLRKLRFLGGILVLKRFHFRGNPRYEAAHRSKSGWFVEDRYYLDAIVDQTCQRPQDVPPKDPKGAKRDSTKAAEDVRYTLPMRRVVRVYPDSFTCAQIPCVAPHPDLSQHNRSIAESLPEYYPAPDVVILTWHEMADYVNASKSGIYALSNFVAVELEQGVQRPLGNTYFWGQTETGEDVDLSGATASPPEWRNPLRAELANSYASFFVRSGTAGPTSAFVPNTRAQAPSWPRDDAPIPTSPLFAQLVKYLLVGARGSAYLGNGLFRLGVANAGQLAAGNRQWGSGESGPIVIVATPEDATNNEVAGQGYTYGTGGGRLLVDFGRYLQRDTVAEELAACQTKTTGECIDCVKDSLAYDYYRAGIAVDFCDMVAGIVCCVLWPASCPATAPSAGAAAKSFWNNAFGGYDYAEDVCYGSSAGGGSYQDGAQARCVEKGPINGPRDWPPGTDPATIRAYSMAECRNKFGQFTEGGLELRDATYTPASPGQNAGKIKCIYCGPEFRPS